MLRSARSPQPGRALAAVLVGTVLVVAVLALAIVSGRDGPKGVADAEAFDLPALQGGGRVRLEDQRGLPTVVNLFASWCVECETELPTFHRAGTALRGRVNFVFVNANETGDGRAMARRHRLFDFPVATDVGRDRDGLYLDLGGLGGMPYTAFYDGSGALVTIFPGPLLGDRLAAQLDRYFGVTVPA